MRARRFMGDHVLALSLGGLAVIGTTAIGGVAVAAGSPGGPARTVPAEVANAKVQTAEAANGCPRQQCNAAARDERVAAFPPAQPIDSRKPFISAAAATAKARSQAENPAASRLSLPAKAVQMTMGQLDAKLGIGDDPLIASNRPVWVVTVHGDMTTDAAPSVPKPTTQHVYTEVYDAPSGALILEAIGVDALK